MGHLAEHYAKTSALMFKTLFGSETWLTAQFFIAFLAVLAVMWVAAATNFTSNTISTSE